MSIVKLDTGFNIEVELAISSRQRRFSAWFIDLMIQGFYLAAGAELLNILTSSKWHNKLWAEVLYILPYAFYHLVSEIGMNGQSFGKKAMNIKVVTAEGGQPSFSQYLLRWVFRLIDFPYLHWLLILTSEGSLPAWTFIFSAPGFTCFLLTRRSQRIGDIVAGTVLIYAKTKASWQDTIFMEVEESYQPAFPQVMQLSDRDINSIRQVLATAENNFSNREYAERVAAKIQKALQLSVDMDCIDFLEKLIKDYNYLSSK